MNSYNQCLSEIRFNGDQSDIGETNLQKQLSYRLSTVCRLPKTENNALERLKRLCIPQSLWSHLGRVSLRLLRCRKTVGSLAPEGVEA